MHIDEQGVIHLPRPAKRFQINEKELNFLSEMFVYIQHDNEVSEQGLGEMKEVFDRVRSRPVVQTIIDPELFSIDHHNDYPREEKEMTNETQVVPAAPVVTDYMEFVSNDDRQGAQDYLVKFFGSDGNEDQEGLAEFSKAVMEASQAKTEAALEEAAVAESSEIDDATEEMQATAEVLATEATEVTEEAPAE